VAEDLEIKVKADTGEAVANLGKAEKAVEGVTKKTKELDAAGKKAGDSIGTSVSKQVSGFTQLAEGFGKVTMIFGLAVAAGKALAAGIDAISASLEKSARIEGEAIDRKIKFDKAMRLATAGTIAPGHSTEEMLRNYEEYVAKMNPATKATEAQAKALAEQAKQMAELGEAIKKASAGRGFTLISPEEANAQLDSIKSLAKGLEDILSKAFKAGGDEERDAWAAANEDAVKKVVESYNALGLTVPPNIKAVMDARFADIESAKAWADAQVEAEARVADVMRKRSEESAARNFSTPETAENLQRIQYEAVGAAAAAGEFGTSLDTVAKKVVSLNGQLTVQQQIWLSVAMASDEATAALYRQVEATRALSDTQKESLDAVRGWSDYIIALKEGYESGVTSLGSYIQQLIAFKSQLSQMFAAAEGDAKKSLEEMIQLIETLMQTAGARQGGASGPVGWLDKAVRDAKGGA